MTDAPVVPIVREYGLDLDVQHAALSFSGSVDVVLDAPVRHLRLNSMGLEVDSPIEGSRVVAHPELEECWIDLPTAASTVPVRFRGRADDKGLIGLYRSRYGNGYILTTQCQTTGARRLFPCIDRPDRKAVVRLRLTIDPNLEAIFNMPARATSESGGRQAIEFDPTPAMSTYLTYLAVGRFDWLRGPSGRVRVSLAAPPGRAAAGAFAVARASEILPALERYYGIPFPLPKLDLIAVPEFAYGAMENWGAISFREMRLLVDETTNARQRRSTLTTIAHEIAHQWFGDLVTMGWWTDIWLNESFATFLEEKIVEELYPSAGALSEFLLDWTGAALSGDSLPTTHPVRVAVQTPDEIDQIYDEISYGKGSAVLRMIDAFIGPQTFRRGVTAYLRAHSYANATSEDLWKALEDAAGRPLRPLLAAWIARPGVPLLRARLEDGALRLTQERFSLDGRHRAETWPIPLAVASDGRIDRRLMEGPSEEVRLTSRGPIHLNPGAVGFYRVLYDPALYERLRSEFPRLPETDRWSILQDLVAFVLSGDLPLDRYYEFLDASRDTRDYLVVHELASQLSSTSPGRPPTALGALLGTDTTFGHHALPLLRGQIGRIGLEARPGESEEAAVLRDRVASSLVPLDREFARSLADRVAGYDRLPADLRWPVALASADLGSEPEFDALLGALGSSPDEGDASRLERALARFHRPHLVERTLELALSPTFNRAHLGAVVREAALNPEGRAVTWNWIRTRLHEVEGDYRGTGIVGDILHYAVPYAALGRLPEARAELSERPFREGDRGAAKGLVLLERYERLLARVRGAEAPVEGGG